MRNKVAGLAMPNGIPQPGRIGCDDRCSACRRLEVRDSPPFLRRCKHQRPRTPQQRELLRLAYKPKKPHAVAEVKRARELLEPEAIVTSAGDVEHRRRMRQPCEGLHDQLDLLVPLEAPKVRETRRPRSGGRIWREAIDVHAVVNDGNRVRRDPARHEVESRALGDGLEGNSAVEPPERSLGRPDRRGDWWRGFREDGAAKEMV